MVQLLLLDLLAVYDQPLSIFRLHELVTHEFLRVATRHLLVLKAW